MGNVEITGSVTKFEHVRDTVNYRVFHFDFGGRKIQIHMPLHMFTSTIAYNANDSFVSYAPTDEVKQLKKEIEEVRAINHDLRKKLFDIRDIVK